MNIRRERALETFLYITFPIALFIGCAGSSDFNASSGLPDFLPERFAVGQIIGGNGDSNQNEWLDIVSNALLPTQEQDSWPMLRNGNTLADAIVTSPDVSLTPSEYVLRFAPDEFKIATEDLQILRQHARFLARNSNLIVTITGFADSNIGRIGRHNILAQERAEQVFRALMAFGAPVEQLIVDSYEGTNSVENSGYWGENRVELLYFSIVVEREKQ